MILLDENVDELQRRRLRIRRIHFKHIGTSIGRRGMKDVDEILPLLHSLRQSTFFTFDLGLYHPKFRHNNHCLVCLGRDAGRRSGIYSAIPEAPEV